MNVKYQLRGRKAYYAGDLVGWAVILWVAFILTVIVGYVINVAWLVKTAVAGVEEVTAQLVISAAGLLVFPLGAIHGFFLWFN